MLDAAASLPPCIKTRAALHAGSSIHSLARPPDTFAYQALGLPEGLKLDTARASMAV